MIADLQIRWQVAIHRVVQVDPARVDRRDRRVSTFVRERLARKGDESVTSDRPGARPAHFDVGSTPRTRDGNYARMRDTLCPDPSRS